MKHNFRGDEPRVLDVIERAAKEAEADASAAYGRIAMWLEEAGDPRTAREFIADRLAVGCDIYGPLDVHQASREWRRERIEEDADGLVYWACDELSRS